jgi:hypothetical protein
MITINKYLVIALLLISNIVSFAQEKQGNTANAEIFADAPFRMKKYDDLGNVKAIPIHIFAHDADNFASNILLMSIDISIKNAADTNFTNILSFDSLSTNDFEDLLILQSPDNNNLDIQDFSTSAYQKSSNHTIEFIETHDAIDGSDYVEIDSKYWYFTIMLPGNVLQTYDDIVDIKVYFNVDWAVDDETDLRVFRTKYDIPKIDNWYRGDVHYHSIFTQNTAEIGLPLEATKLAAKEVGDDWLITTDHSCDFDNYGVGMSENWQFLQQTIQTINQEDSSFIFIPGMETSVNNSAGNVVHALTYPSPDSIYSMPYLVDGGGDLSATQFTVDKLLDTLNYYGGFCYAAHPFAEGDKLSFAVDGSVWNLNDSDFPENDEAHPSAGTVICNDLQSPSDVYSSNPNQFFKHNLMGLQIWNLRNTIETSDQNYNPWNIEYDAGITPFTDLSETETMHHLFRLLQNFDLTDFLWTKGLIAKNNNQNLENWKFYISAGTDAHGSFNYSNTDLAYGIGSINDNAIGKLSTLIYSENGIGTSGKNILDGLKNGRTILSSGPIVTLGLSQTVDNETPEIFIGMDTVLNLSDIGNYNIITNTKTSEIFGNIESVKLIINTEDYIYEYPLSNIEGLNSVYLDEVLENVFGVGNIPTDKYFLIRVEIKTSKNYGSLSSLYKVNHENFRSYTNPIWIKLATTSDIISSTSYKNITISYLTDCIIINYSSLTEEISNIELYNSVGQKIINITPSESNMVNIYKSKLKPDVYLVKLQGENHLITKKLVVY